MRDFLDRFIANPLGAFVVLSFAALLEVLGDSYFQAGLYKSNGASRIGSFAAGAAVLTFYGLVVNLPRWDFGRLLGIYVVLFFIVAQILAKIRFNQSPTPPILVGGSLIIAGGLVIAFCRH